MSTLTRLTSGGQVTLPKEIRMKTNMQPVILLRFSLMRKDESY